MSSICRGDRIRDFDLPTSGGDRLALRQALSKGPVILVFYKISCPVCQLALPFLERMHQHYSGSRISILGISQDDRDATVEFCRDFGLTFTALLDEPDFPVSNAVGLTNVPTVYLLSAEATVESYCVGFDRAAFDQINEMVAGRLGTTPAEMFLPGELVPDFQPG
jgi:peroxiredoxin